MTETPKKSSARPIPSTVVGSEDEEIDPRVAEILDGYFEQLQAGNPPDAAALLSAHPDVADELRSCLDGIHLVHSSAEPLKELGDFQIVREVGRGGMGVVYEAEQVSLKRRVALKVLRFAVADPDAMTRFRREAETVAKLHHSNIVPIYAVGQADGVNYFAMQFIDGQSLAEFQQAAVAPFDALDIADWGLQAAEALAYAHQHGVIHRDVKPSNLIRDPQGRVWLTDFGLAKRLDDVKLSLTGAILGTPRYMSPEQASSVRRPVDHRTDIYSLGATLYELATDKPLFDAESPHIALGKIISDEPVPPRVVRPKLARDLETIITRCLSKNAENRYESASELVDDLQAFIDGRAIRARRPSWAELLGHWLQKNQRLVTTAATAAAIATTLVVGLSFAIREHQAAKLGHIQFESTRQSNAPLVAEIRRDDGTEVVPSFTIPTQHPVEIPAGDYELQLHAASNLSDSYRFSVHPSTREQVVTNLEERDVWPTKHIEGPWTVWQRPDGNDIVIFDSRGVTLIDGTTSETLWSSDLRDKHVELEKSKSGNAIHWWHENSRCQNETGFATVLPPFDCNQDGTTDLILACKYRPTLIALSGDDGKLLWCCSSAEPKQDHLEGGIVGTPLVVDIDDDNVSDVIGLFTQLSDDRRSNSCSVKAISGATGEPLWHYAVEPSLHNRRQQPYPPYATRLLVHHDRHIAVQTETRNGGVGAYRMFGVCKSKGDSTQLSTPYAPQFEPNSQQREIVLFAGAQRVNLDTRTGESISTNLLEQTPVRPPQWIDSDGDGTLEALVCTRILPIKRNTRLNEAPAMRVALWDFAQATPRWQSDVHADWEWMLNYDERVRASRRWPLLRDLDHDGSTEIVLPAASTANEGNWTVLPVGRLQVLDLKSGKHKWTSDPIINMESQLSHFEVTGDVDADGFDDIAVVTQYSGPEKDRKDEEPQARIFVDMMSGNSGKRIGRIHSRSFPLRLGLCIANAQAFDDFTLQVQVTKPLRQRPRNSEFDHVMLFDVLFGRQISSTDRVTRTQLCDLDGDNISELLAWTPADRQEFSAPNSQRRRGRLHAWKRPSASTNRTWKYANQSLTVAGDVNGDGVDDAISQGSDQYINLVSGATGRYLWTYRHESKEELRVYRTKSDYDGDGVEDFLIAETCQRLVRQSPLRAISGRTGERLWRYQMNKAGSWDDEKLIATTDIDGDGRDEILMMHQGIYPGAANPRVLDVYRPLHLSCFDSHGGLRWTTEYVDAKPSVKAFSHNRFELADVTGDGVQDLVGYHADDNFNLRMQAWNGTNGMAVWGQKAGLLPTQVDVDQQTRYPRFCVANGSRPMIITSSHTPRLHVRALDAETGEPAWDWSFRGTGQSRLSANPPTPTRFRTESGEHIGFWLVDEKNACDFQLLSSEDGSELHRFSIAQQNPDEQTSDEWLQYQFSLYITAADLDSDGLDEVIYRTPTHLVAYSLTNEVQLWEFEIPSRSHQIASVEETATGDIETKLLLLRDDSQVDQIMSINPHGKLAWSKQFAGSSVFRNKLDILQSSRPNEAPRILRRIAEGTICQVAAFSQLNSSEENQFALRAGSRYQQAGQPDPRQFRRLQVGTPTRGSLFHGLFIALFLLIIPFVYVRHLARGRWTLRMLLLMPVVVGLAIVAAQWPPLYNPTNSSTVGWNVSQSIMHVVAFVPFAVLLWLILQGFKRHNWPLIAVLCLGAAAGTIVVWLFVLQISGYFREIGPVRYAWDGTAMMLFGGIQVFGMIVTIVMILGRMIKGVRKRLVS